MDWTAYLTTILPPNRWDTDESINSLYQIGLRKKTLFQTINGFALQSNCCTTLPGLILLTISVYLFEFEKWTNIYDQTEDIKLSNKNKVAMKSKSIWAPEFVMGRSVLVGRALINKNIISAAKWNLKFGHTGYTFQQGILIGVKKQVTSRTICCNFGFGKGMEYTTDWPQVGANYSVEFSANTSTNVMVLQVHNESGTQVLYDTMNTELTDDNYQLVLVMTQKGSRCEIEKFVLTEH
eukprot:355608_1